MKILYINSALAIWGGIERVLIDKMNYLANQKGYNIYMITTDQGEHIVPYFMDSRIIYSDLNIRFHKQYKLPIYKRIYVHYEMKYRFRSKLNDVLVSIKPDIIISTADNFVDDILSVKRNIPYIVESHSTKKFTRVYENRSLNILEKMKRFLYLNKLKKISTLVVLTDGDAKEWCNIKIPKVIPNPVHLNSEKTLSTCSEKQAIFVGRLSKQKGLDLLIQVWALVNRIYPDWTLSIYGEGQLENYYRQIIDNYPGPLNIRVYAPVKNINNEYKKSSMLLLTSIYEPFGLVIPEAMSYGLPVVAFDCPYGPRTIISDQEDGFLIKSGDVKSFADKVIFLIKNEEIRKKMGFAASVNSRRFSAEIIMPMWINLFNKLTKE
jgi:glycosyltransferase involved in cell wall biosynthesis